MTQLKSPLIWRLTLWFLLLSLIPIGIVLVFVQRQVRTTVVEQQIQGLSDQARLLSFQIASQSDDTQKTIDTLAKDGLRAFVVDQNGTYLAHSEATKVGKSANADIGAEAFEQLLSGQVTNINDVENLQYIGTAKI